MKRLKNYSLAAISFAILVTSLMVAAGGHTSARAAGEAFLAYGVGGITAGQTARFHAVSVGTPDIQPVELAIYDSAGNLLGSSQERLLPGRAATLELPFGERSGNRLELYAVVRFINGYPRAGYVIPTLEVVDDATGKTIFMFTDPVG